MEGGRHPRVSWVYFRYPQVNPAMVVVANLDSRSVMNALASPALFARTEVCIKASGRRSSGRNYRHPVVGHDRMSSRTGESSTAQPAGSVKAQIGGE